MQITYKIANYHKEMMLAALMCCWMTALDAVACTNIAVGR